MSSGVALTLDRAVKNGWGFEQGYWILLVSFEGRIELRDSFRKHWLYYVSWHDFNVRVKGRNRLHCVRKIEKFSHDVDVTR